MIMGIDGRPANEENKAGIGNYCNELLGALLPLAGAGGHSVRIYLDREPAAGFPVGADEGEICVLPPCRGWTQRRLAKELRRRPPDVFLSCGLQMPLLCSCPRVPTVLDLAYYDFGAQFPWTFRVGARMQARLAMRYAAHLIAISHATKADCTKRFRRNPADISVVHLAPSARYRPCPDPDTERIQEVRHRLDLPERYVLYVGTLQPRKNLGRLIEAFADLRQRQPQMPHHLVIAGAKGWLYDEVFEAAQRSSARDHLHFLGFVPEDDLPILMAEADLLALVSLWEGFGLPVLEAMACGTAVLTSNCSSLPEIVGDGGVQVDPYDTSAMGQALEGILLDDAFRKTLEGKALAQSKNFTWERTAATILDVLKRVAC